RLAGCRRHDRWRPRSDLELVYRAPWRFPELPVFRPGERGGDVRHRRHGRVLDGRVEGETARVSTRLMMKRHLRSAGAACLVLIGMSWAVPALPQQQYDLLLKNGHVIDPKNSISAVRDVAIANGAVAMVAANINPADSLKVVDVSGLYVTPGLVDIHAHVYAGTGERNSYAGDNSVYPDGFTFRAAVTTVADARCSGWRNFEDFKERVIDRSKTRILALLNIVGHGMRGGQWEQDLSDMEAKPTAEMALRHKGLIVGIKTAH